MDIIIDWLWVIANSLTAEGVSAIADVFVATSALFAFRQFKREGVWKRKEWLSQFFDGLGNSPGSRNAALMLDSPEREVPLWDAADPKERYEEICWKDVEVALVPPRSGKVRNEPTYSAIRDSFLDLLNRFSGLEKLAQEGLVSDCEIEDALRYWFYIIRERDGHEPHIRNLRLFIKEREMKTAKQVFARFGVNVDETYEADLASFLKSDD